MILAVLDDLMFTSKIRSTAAQLGVQIAFARSSAAALEQMKRERPAAVIFDLDNPRTDPLGTLGAMKADASLAEIPTVGYVSHVHVEMIDAARRSGMNEVLPRSAFAGGLSTILARY
jgi:PleD family two-component response regulator